MKTPLRVFLLTSAAGLFPLIALTQSTMEFDAGSAIEVTSDADICADNVIFHDNYSGDGTQCGSVLPVELISFTAFSDRLTAVLKWKTATELDNAGWEVERRTIKNQMSNVEYGDWINVGFVKGAGTSTRPLEYSYEDLNLTRGTYTYRLKHIDRKGAFTYSLETTVDVGVAPRVFTLSQNYPNPFNPATTIEFTLEKDGRVSLQVYDILGRRVATLLDENRGAGEYQQVVFKAARLASGIYLVRLESEGRHKMLKMLLMK